MATAITGADRNRYGRALPAAVRVLSMRLPTKRLPATTTMAETIGSIIEKTPNWLSVRPMTSA